RIARAVMAGETIALVTDHDVDGVTSHAVLIETLTRWFGVPPERVASFIGHRLKEGYGLSDPVAERIVSTRPRPSVVITADCGSSDEDRIARLAGAGMDVIVTDHHEMMRVRDEQGQLQEVPPPSALAVVNPARADSQYGDRQICGVMVTWLTLCAARTCLIEARHLHEDTPSLGALLDYVALGTVADCVSLAQSSNNRAVVRRGLDLMNGRALPDNRKRACWRAADHCFNDPNQVSAQDLAFGLGPRINACGRLSDAFAGLRFLLAKTQPEAVKALGELEALNDERKAIGKDLAEVAMLDADI